MNSILERRDISIEAESAPSGLSIFDFPPEKPRVKGRALVVEDNLVNQRVIVQMIEKRGYAVDVVAQGSTPDGLQVERADFLYFEVQSGPAGVPLTLALMIIAGITLITVIIFWLMNSRGRKAKQSW